MKELILVVDDERELSKFIKMTLVKAGYRVQSVSNADAAFAYLKQNQIDLVILDIQLPGISGLEFLELLKRDPKTSALPVMLLTVLKDEYHKLKGLKSGADDYLVKPFSHKELVARVEALMRRVYNAGRVSNVLKIEELSIELDEHRVFVDEDLIDLTETEFNILALLAQRRGILFSYESISDRLHGDSRVLISTNLHAHIKNLRKKLKKAGRYIKTIHGRGYRFSIE